jgi:putative PIG3 family NAD(P)H quinone oxidoreductase
VRAVVITRSGGPEVLEVQDRPTPGPAGGQLLVRVMASALNRADLLQREGKYPAPPGSPPDIPGMEFAGEVVRADAAVDTGSGASAAEPWRVGDRVFGIVGGGANAEYLTTDAGAVARVPDALSWVAAASVPEAFITAYDAMVTQAALGANEHVLIHAVGSGVGLAAVQIARAWGAVPYGTARSASKVDRARALGLADGLTVDGDPEPIVAAAERWTNGHGIDVTLDLVGGAYVDVNVRAAARGGRILLVGTVAGRTGSVPLGVMLGKRLTMRGTVMRARSAAEKREVAAAFARDVVPLLARGQLKPVVDSVFALDEIRAAHERLASNATFGKVVIRSGG